MPIHFQLYRGGKPTGHVQEVASPHELTGRNPQHTRKIQGRQQRLLTTLDRSAKWQRADTPAPAAPQVDVDALVDQRVAEQLAAIQAAKDAETATPAAPARTRSKTKATPDTETPAV